MTEFIAAAIVFLLVFLVMAIGLIVRGQRLKLACGGMNNLKKLIGQTPCDACCSPSPSCPHRRPDQK